MQADSLTNQFYFETIVLQKIIKILDKQPHKIEHIVRIINLNCQNDTLSKYFPAHSKLTPLQIPTTEEH